MIADADQFVREHIQMGRAADFSGYPRGAPDWTCDATNPHTIAQKPIVKSQNLSPEP